MWIEPDRKGAEGAKVTKVTVKFDLPYCSPASERSRSPIG
ncbi:hypothetical protein FHS96_001395 [Sphingomonas zeicaulis]